MEKPQILVKIREVGWLIEQLFGEGKTKLIGLHDTDAIGLALAFPGLTVHPLSALTRPQVVQWIDDHISDGINIVNDPGFFSNKDASQ